MPENDITARPEPRDPVLFALEKKRLARLEQLERSPSSLKDEVSDTVVMAFRIAQLLKHASGTLCEAKDYGLAMMAEEIAEELADRLDAIEVRVMQLEK